MYGFEVGPRSLEEIIEIKKALEVNPGKTDIAQLRDGEVLGLQSMDEVRVSLTWEEADFEFIRSIPVRSVDQILNEYNQYISHGGGYPYNKPFIGQSDRPRYDDPRLKRLYSQMAYMADGFQYNRPSKVVRSIEDPETLSSTASMARLLEAHSVGFWHNNRDLMPNEDFGLFSQVTEVYDCRGKLPDAQVIQEIATVIRRKYSGLVNHFVMPLGTKNLMDNRFAHSGAQYVLQHLPMGTSGVVESNVVKGVNCSQAKDGIVQYVSDRWIDLSHISVPLNVDGVEAAVGINPPGTPTLAAAEVVPTVPGSLWDADWIGTQRYRVVAVAHHGASLASTEATVNVQAGGAVTLTITPAGTGQATQAFVILRYNPDKGEFRYLTQVKRTASGNTVYTDTNQHLPGYGQGMLGDFNGQGGPNSPKRTLQFAELLPPTKLLLPLGSGDNERMYRGYIEWYRNLQCQAPPKFNAFINLPVD